MRGQVFFKWIELKTKNQTAALLSFGWVFGFQLDSLEKNLTTVLGFTFSLFLVYPNRFLLGSSCYQFFFFPLVGENSPTKNLETFFPPPRKKSPISKINRNSCRIPKAKKARRRRRWNLSFFPHLKKTEKKPCPTLPPKRVNYPSLGKSDLGDF